MCVIYISIGINCCCSQHLGGIEIWSYVKQNQNYSRLCHCCSLPWLGSACIECGTCTGWYVEGLCLEGSLGLGQWLFQQNPVCAELLCAALGTGDCRVSPVLPLPCSCIICRSVLAAHWDDSPTAPVWLSSLARGRSGVWRHRFLLLQNECSSSVKPCAAHGQVIPKKLSEAPIILLVNNKAWILLGCALQIGKLGKPS